MSPTPTIRRRFGVTIAACILFLLVGGAGTFTGIVQIGTILRVTRQLEDLSAGLHVLREVSLEYVASPSPRAESQWYFQYASIARSMAAAPGIPREIADAYSGVRGIFGRITRSAAAASIPEQARAMEMLRTQQLSSLLTETQRIIDWVGDITAESRDRQMALVRFYSAGAVAILVLISVTTAWLLYTTGRSIIRSVAILRSGAETISKGDLAHRMPSLGRDEFGELAGVFNLMAGRVELLYRDMEQTNRALRTITACHQVLVRAPGRDELFRGICRQVVVEGNYRFCWIGLAGDDPRSWPLPVAWHGDGAAYLGDHAAWAERPGCPAEPVAAAIAEGAPCVIQDVSALDAPSPWRDAATESGFGAIVGLPLFDDGTVIGGMGIYAGERGAFVSGEVALFRDLARDVSFGIRALRDRTERQRNEEQLSAAKRELEEKYEELRKIDVIKDGLLYDVTHELKTPVAKQAMQIELLRSALDPAALAGVEGILRVMESSIRRQTQVIKDMLHLARLESGGKRYSIAPVRLDEVIGRVVEDYRSSLDAVGMALSPSVPPVVVRSDAEMLWHVFSNLLNNAIKFRRTDVRGLIGIDVKQRAETAVVRIRDNGIGLAPPDLTRVFERFYQATPATEGSGVGLSICKVIMQDLGGAIALESEGPGTGTTAVVTIPLA